MAFSKLFTLTPTPCSDAKSGACANNASASPDPWRLLLVSFLSLYVELMLIRWIPSTVHVVSFFNNLVLIGSFLGLGIGMARAIDPSMAARQAFQRLAVAVAVLACLNLINPSVLFSNKSDLGINEGFASMLVSLPMPAIMVGVFALVVWVMIPVGRLVAAYFDRMERIPAYSINVAGSLLGVLAFTLVAFLGLPPLLWFALGLGLLWILGRERTNLLVGLAILALITAQQLGETRGFKSTVAWSPYYKVIAQPVFPRPSTLDDGFTVQVNDQFLLSGFNLRDDAAVPANADLKTASAIRMLRSYYNFPFRLRPAKRVLILGSGAGNDVATALRHEAEHVTAVEIDPLVLKLGRHHPERPYDSSRVRIVNDDGRSFLNRNREKFDLIIFATLDSHGLLSSVGNVRLDGFIYTKESLAAARDHLAPGGLMVLSFGPFREEVQYRQYATVRSVFGQEPLFFLHANDHRTIVAGGVAGLGAIELPREWRRIGPAEIEAKLQEYPYATTPATDNWPHLYLRQPRVPAEYLWVLAGILALSTILVRTSFRGTATLDGHFLFLGAGFLLLETKSVTEFALLVGSTWQVNSAVFAVILLMILVANLFVLKAPRPLPLPWCYGAIFAILLAEYFWPIGQWATSAGPVAYTLAAVYLGTPILLAALIFATTFRNTRLGSAALASNLLGAVLGGTTEYLSLAYGIRALSLLALAMYAGSLLVWLRQRSKADSNRAAESVVANISRPRSADLARAEEGTEVVGSRTEP